MFNTVINISKQLISGGIIHILC